MTPFEAVFIIISMKLNGHAHQPPPGRMTNHCVVHIDSAVRAPKTSGLTLYVSYRSRDTQGPMAVLRYIPEYIPFTAFLQVVNHRWHTSVSVMIDFVNAIPDTRGSLFCSMSMNMPTKAVNLHLVKTSHYTLSICQ